MKVRSGLILNWIKRWHSRDGECQFKRQRLRERERYREWEIEISIGRERDREKERSKERNRLGESDREGSARVSGREWDRKKRKRGKINTFDV